MQGVDNPEIEFYYVMNDTLQELIMIVDGECNQFEPGIFDDLIAAIKSKDDPWMTIADFRSYINAQKRVEAAYRDKNHWVKMSILNCANSGKFSTDRTINDYNSGIWKLEAVPVQYPPEIYTKNPRPS